MCLCLCATAQFVLFIVYVGNVNGFLVKNNNGEWAGYGRREDLHSCVCEAFSLKDARFHRK